MELFNKSRVPTNADAFNITADMRLLAESLNVVIPVYNVAERDALPASEGLTVVRMDRWEAPIETYQNGEWAEGHTPWVPLPLTIGLTSQGDNFNPHYSRVGQTVFIRGAVKRTTGTFSAGMQQIINSTIPLPAWARPISEDYYTTPTSNPAEPASVRITTSGQITASPPAGASYVFLTVSYRAGDMGAL